MKNLISFIWLFFVSTHTLASDGNAYNGCFKEASSRYGIDVAILKSIAKVESNFNPSAINVNSNGTKDYGIMQINSSWFPKLRKFGISAESVIHDSCTNIAVGAWILAWNFKSYGVSWDTLAMYNTGPKNTDIASTLRKKYANKVRVRLVTIGEHDETTR